MLLFFQSYIIYANRARSFLGDEVFIGDSCIADPIGNILAVGSLEEGVVDTAIDLDQLEIRKEMNYTIIVSSHPPILSL